MLSADDIRTGLLLRERIEKWLSYFSTKTYIVGTQKNRLNETFLLSTQNITFILSSSEGSYESVHGHILV